MCKAMCTCLMPAARGISTERSPSSETNVLHQARLLKLHNTTYHKIKQPLENVCPPPPLRPSSLLPRSPPPEETRLSLGFRHLPLPTLRRLRSRLQRRRPPLRLHQSDRGDHVRRPDVLSTFPCPHLLYFTPLISVGSPTTPKQPLQASSAASTTSPTQTPLPPPKLTSSSRTEAAGVMIA